LKAAKFSLRARKTLTNLAHVRPISPGAEELRSIAGSLPHTLRVQAERSSCTVRFQEHERRMLLAQPGIGPTAYFSPSWTAFQADRGRDFSVIVDGVSN
jgi:hypothetical protein